MPDSKCSENVEGCLTAEDCDTGLECNRLAARPHCVDIDECSDLRPWAGTGLAYCGHNATCHNSGGSFYCTCHSGYQNFQGGQGCFDIDECTLSEGINYCGQNTHCNNHPGTFECNEDDCKDGYTNWRANYGCYQLLGAPSAGSAQPANWYWWTGDVEIAMHKGRLGIFVVGGGGYACSSFGAGSGHFEYFVVNIEEDDTRIYVDIGNGGHYHQQTGGSTIVYINYGKSNQVKYEADGGGCRQGWSGGHGTNYGGSNGATRTNNCPGTGKSLPTLPSPGPSITPADGGPRYPYEVCDWNYSYCSSYSYSWCSRNDCTTTNYGGGGGGVIVGGNQPSRGTTQGRGYGGGGGEWSRDGAAGVAVFVTGPSV